METRDRGWAQTTTGRRFHYFRAVPPGSGAVCDNRLSRAVGAPMHARIDPESACGRCARWFDTSTGERRPGSWA